MSSSLEWRLSRLSADLVEFLQGQWRFTCPLEQVVGLLEVQLGVQLVEQLLGSAPVDLLDDLYDQRGEGEAYGGASGSGKYQLLVAGE